MYDLPMVPMGYGQIALSSTTVYTLASAVQASFTGTGTGTSLVVTSVTGFIRIGSTLAGSGVPAGTTILAQVSGTANGAGTYTTSAATTSNSASLTTSGIPPGANVAILTVSTANVRWRDDGAAPTASVGVLIPAATVPYQYTATLSAFQLTAVSGSPTVGRGVLQAMTISLTPTQTQELTALRAFLLNIMPGSDVILAQVNRVPEPSTPDFTLMNPIRKRRLGTNFDDFVDTKLTGSIAGSTMTITGVHGALKVGSVVFGVNVGNGTQVTAFGTGSGGLGTYTVSPAQTIASETLAAGVLDALQPTEWTVQLDVHGPNGSDNAQRISTMFRDDYAVQFFNAQNPNVAPFYADDPRQIPFINAESQYEDRWIVEACMQINATVQDIPQQFFEQINTTLIPADIVEPV